MITTPEHPYVVTLRERFGGKLLRGKHSPDGEACALEVAAIARGLAWTDDPMAVGLPDIRPLNDAKWESDKARTAAIVPVVLALWDWPEWSLERKVAWAQTIALRTVTEILPLVLERWPAHAKACHEATDLVGARAAANAAANAVAAYAYATTTTTAYAATTATAYATTATTTATTATTTATTATAYAAAATAYAAATAAAATTALLAGAARIWVEEAERSADVNVVR